MLKTTRAALPVLAALTLSLAVSPGTASAQTFGGNVGFSWQIPGAPAAGLTDISFSTKFNPETARVAGNYVADQFNFMNQKDVGYMGLQPRPDQGGKQRLHAAFSSFIAGTTSGDAQCSNGADGGAGVSCAVDFEANYLHGYTLTVARTGTDTWSGTVTDVVTGSRTHIGSYVLPANSGNLRASQSGFVENYNTKSCATVPRIDVSVGAPTTSSGLSGNSSKAHEYGDCLGQANYASSAEGNGLRIQRGWQ